MVRKLLIVSCLIGPVFAAFGQNRPNEKALVSTTDDKKIDYKAIGAPLPAMRMNTLEGKTITDKDLENDANLLIMLFNPTCDHCQDQAVILKNNLALVNKSKILFLAAKGMGPYLSFFTSTTKIDSFSRLQIAVDSAEYIDKVFNYTSLPQMNIYDKERKLIKVFNGTKPIDSLKKYIE
jgi:hypothetical protein